MWTWMSLVMLAAACGEKDGPSGDDSTPTDDSGPTDDTNVEIESPIALGVWESTITEMGTDSCGSTFEVGDIKEMNASITEEGAVAFDVVVELTFSEEDVGAFSGFGLVQTTLEGKDCVITNAITLNGRYTDPKTIPMMNRTDAMEFSGTECAEAPNGGTPCAIDYKVSALWLRDGGEG